MSDLTEGARPRRRLFEPVPDAGVQDHVGVDRDKATEESRGRESHWSYHGRAGVRDRSRASAAASRPACRVLPSRCTQQTCLACRATVVAVVVGPEPRVIPGSHNHHRDRDAVRAVFAVRLLVRWADRRMSPAVLFAAAS